jgi:hypothetical protein
LGNEADRGEGIGDYRLRIGVAGLWNEANRVGRPGGNGGGTVGLARCLEAIEVGHRDVIGPFEGGDAALNQDQTVAQAVVAVGEGLGFLEVVPLAAMVDLGVPELAFGGAHAAEEPVGMKELIDESDLTGASRPAGGRVRGGEVIEHKRVFAVDEEGLRVEAGFDGVPGGRCFTGRGAGSGGFLRIAAIRFDLR